GELPSAGVVTRIETAGQVERSAEVAAPEALQRVPTASEVLAEAAELGAMLAEAWWQTAGRVTELAVVEPMRAIAHLAAMARPRPAAAVPRRGTGGGGEGRSGS